MLERQEELAGVRKVVSELPEPLGKVVWLRTWSGRTCTAVGRRLPDRKRRTEAVSTGVAKDARTTGPFRIGPSGNKQGAFVQGRGSAAYNPAYQS